jgi:hypothetical protein
MSLSTQNGGEPQPDAHRRPLSCELDQAQYEGRNRMCQAIRHLTCSVLCFADSRLARDSRRICI